MPEIKLKARLLNKYETLEEWNLLVKGEFTPLKGEICYGIDEGVLYQKVGDGKTDFLDLPWLLNQGDWNEENELSPEYIKNRPFYSEITNEIDTNIIPLQEVEGVTLDGMPEGYLGFILDGLDSDLAKKLASIVDKGQYNLTIDGKTEQITTTAFDSECFLFGNLSILGIGDDTGETYVGTINVQYDDYDGYWGDFALVLQTTETTHTIELSHIGDIAPIVVEDTYSFENIDGVACRYFINMWEASFEGDNVYNLTFDGEIYKGLSWIYHEDSGLDLLGNLSIVGMGDDTGEKYLLAKVLQDDGSGSVALTLITSYEAGNYTFSLGKSLVKTIETIHKIDSKYLDIDVEVPYTEDDKGNVTFKGDVKTSSGTSLNAVSNRLNTTNNTLSTVQNSLNTTKNDLNTVKDDLDTTKNDLNTVKDDLDTTKNDLNTVKDDLEANKPVQSDYLQFDFDAKDYIKNKPRIGQDYIVLKDIEDGLDYAIQMKGGSLVTLQLPIEVQITTLPNKTTYYRGDYFDPTGMVITAILPDGSTKIIEDYTASYTDTSFGRVGEIGVIIKANVFVPYIIPLMVTVNEFDPNVILMDFTYTTNDDGTYTLTGWKQSLNGEKSTELVVPNNSLIKI